MTNTCPQWTYGQYSFREMISKANLWGFSISINVHPELEQFKNVKFTISISGACIIFTSGMDISQMKREIANTPLEEMQNV